MIPHQQWLLLASAIGGFIVAASFHAWFLVRFMNRMFEREKDIEDIEQWAKFTRQDVAGIVASLGVTNGLLGAIVALLIFR